MKNTFPLKVGIALLLSSSFSSAESPHGTTTPNSEQLALLDKIYAPADTSELNSLVQEAIKSGISEQNILEAKFIHFVDNNDDKGLAELSTSLESYSDKFSPQTSEIFTQKSDWLSIVHYTKAVAALQNNEKESFKKHITEAFWLSPEQGPVFAQYITQMRQKEIIKSFVLNKNITLNFQNEDASAPLQEVIKEGHEVLLHFWSPETPNAEEDLTALKQQTSDKKRTTLSILIGANADTIHLANKTIKIVAEDKDHLFMLESKSTPLSAQLNIPNLPFQVLISPEGKIISFGETTEKKPPNVSN